MIVKFICRTFQDDFIKLVEIEFRLINVTIIFNSFVYKPITI
jgi:hypothetical protein